MRSLRYLALWLSVVAVPTLVAQTPPTIAAAANLNFALTEVANQFARDRRALRSQLVFGASGMLTRQIQDGAPFEMFLAADEDFPNQLAAAGLTRDAGVVYAVGRLVLFAPQRIAAPDLTNGSMASRASRRHAGASSGSRSPIPRWRPMAAPPKRFCGNAGCGTLFSRHLVLGDTISQAAQFATTGNAVGGLIAYSLALAPGVAGPRHVRS